jgi:hypothetical protein
MIFDPLSLRPHASLNRTRLAALPGAEPEWVGQPAFVLLSRDALVDLLQRVGERSAALIFGRRLGHLIATLHLDSEEDALQTEWLRAYRAHWRTIQQVWLGGGLAARLGGNILDGARSEASRLGSTRVSIEMAAFPANLPLIGAARTSAGDHQYAAVLDLGHTEIKRGVARYANGALIRLDMLESQPAPPPAGVKITVIETIADTLGCAPADVDPTVVVSVASYVSSTGQPEDTQSLYSPLRTLAPAELVQGVRQRVDKPVEGVRFSHDGTLAGAGVLSAAPGAAVIMLGTALGIGFVPPAEHVRLAGTDFARAPRTQGISMTIDSKQVLMHTLPEGALVGDGVTRPRDADVERDAH